jgi:hypothetical protein
LTASTANGTELDRYIYNSLSLSQRVPFAQSVHPSSLTHPHSFYPSCSPPLPPPTLPPYRPSLLLPPPPPPPRPRSDPTPQRPRLLPLPLDTSPRPLASPPRQPPSHLHSISLLPPLVFPSHTLSRLSQAASGRHQVVRLPLLKALHLHAPRDTSPPPPPRYPPLSFLSAPPPRNAACDPPSLSLGVGTSLPTEADHSHSFQPSLLHCSSFSALSSSPLFSSPRPPYLLFFPTPPPLQR